MNDEEKALKELQEKLEQQKQGILLSVSLLNKDEISILIEDTSQVIEDFFSIINQACKKVGAHAAVRQDMPSRLFIVLPDDQASAEKLSHTLYSQIQLHVDKKYPEAYFKCMIGSIKFSDEKQVSAKTLVALLHYGIDRARYGTFYYCYDDNPIDIEKLRRDNKKVNTLRAALLEKKAKFVYQPIVDRESGKIHYYECLLRVADENNQLVSIGPIVSDAEKKGLINIVDFTVLEMVVDELVADKNITLSVNISNIGVLNKRLLKKAESLLKKHDVSKRLIIEITETSLNQDYVSTKKFIDKLHKLGCRFALDDFGSGFTSFKQLLNLPIDIIKIDGSYIRDILSNPHSKFFVEALIRLAEDLGIKTIAEFVENGAIARFLIDIKIGGMQGNFFLPASDSRID